MENNIERLDALLRAVTYDKLEPADREWVDEEIGERSYRELSLLLTGIREEKNLEVDPKVKTDLVRQFKAKHQPAAGLLSYQVPAWVPAMVVIIMTSVIFLLPAKERTITNTVEVPGKTVVDTVYVKQAPDTVVIERRIDVPVYITRVVEPEPEPEQKATVVAEKSLASQEELRSLLKQAGID